MHTYINDVVGLRHNGDATRKNAVIGLYHSSHLPKQNTVSIDDGVYTGSSSSRSRTCSMEHIPISRNTHTHKVDEPPKKKNFTTRRTRRITTLRFHPKYHILVQWFHPKINESFVHRPGTVAIEYMLSGTARCEVIFGQ